MTFFEIYNIIDQDKDIIIHQQFVGKMFAPFMLMLVLLPSNLGIKQGKFEAERCLLKALS